jgi:hypothetical protein
MLTRHDQPNIPNFNFATDSVFNNIQMIPADSIPIVQDYFLLSDGTNFLLSDGSDLLLST